MYTHSSRRAAIKKMVAGTAALGTASVMSSFRSGVIENKQENAPARNMTKLKLRGAIHHSVCRWCYGDISLDDLCEGVKKIGFGAIDLVGPKEWPVLKQHGLWSSMCNGAEISLTKGWNHPEYHPTLINNYTGHIDLVATAGYQNLICFSGNREGMDDETGLRNCVNGLKKIIGHAERKKVIIYMELLNSKVNHPDQMCDNSKWGIELVKRIGSANFKLLYDIYHMQIDEGDVIRTITDNHQYFGHYHTGGVPGRHEIDETQELYYPAIMRAILATGYTGYVAQEFIPTKADKLAALEDGVRICDV
ncbi:MAG TPA: TIM barrel protein [Puia sp.]|jgi:hydroxypyruvate isomerase|nr:TIM barrel protein [Puia sp.]